MHNKLSILRTRRRSRGLYRILSANRSGLPILSVHKSNKKMYAFVNNKDYSSTVLACSINGRNVRAGESLGENIGQQMLEKNITAVVFNKNGYMFHGVVKKIYDTIRKVGVIC